MRKILFLALTAITLLTTSPALAGKRCGAWGYWEETGLQRYNIELGRYQQYEVRSRSCDSGNQKEYRWR